MAMIMDFINWWKDAWDIFLTTLPPLKVSLPVLGVFFIIFSYPFIKDYFEHRKFQKEWDEVEALNIKTNTNFVTTYIQYANEDIPHEFRTTAFANILDLSIKEDVLFLHVNMLNMHSSECITTDTIPLNLNHDWDNIVYKNKKYNGKSLYKFYTDWKNNETLKAIESLP